MFKKRSVEGHEFLNLATGKREDREKELDLFRLLEADLILKEIVEDLGHSGFDLMVKLDGTKEKGYMVAPYLIA